MKVLFEKLLKLQAEALQEIVGREDAEHPATCEPACGLCANNRRAVRLDAQKDFRDFRHTLAELTGFASASDAEARELHAFVINYPLELE